MRILHLSDLHLEFGEMDIPSSNADVVVLSGDVSLGSLCIDWASEFQIPTIVILGNHEFYSPLPMEKIIEECKAKALLHSNVHFLNNDSVLIDGVRFHGGTLWTDFELDGSPESSMRIAKSMMNDFKYITLGHKQFTPEDSVNLHKKTRTWLYNSIDNSEALQNVIITHHLPTATAIQNTYKNSPLSPAFASNCTEFSNLSDKISIWFYGHNHDCRDFMENGIRYSTNQRGYVGNEVIDGFEPNKIIMI